VTTCELHGNLAGLCEECRTDAGYVNLAPLSIDDEFPIYLHGRRLTNTRDWDRRSVIVTVPRRNRFRAD
jgi:hypothetical protein